MKLLQEIQSCWLKRVNGLNKEYNYEFQRKFKEFTVILENIFSKSMNGDIEILVPEEARLILRVGKSKMQELLHRDDFPSYKIARRWYINKAKLIEWINNQ